MGGPALAAVAIVGTVLKAKATIDAGKAQKHLMDAKSAETKLQSRKDALNYREKGVAVLKQKNKDQATAMAQGGASGFNIWDNSNPVAISMRESQANAMRDLTLTEDNAIFAIEMGNFQAANYETAGRNALKNAKLTAVADVAMGVSQAGSVYGTAGFTSDRRLKENIEVIGIHEQTNLTLYEFNYKGDDKRRFQGVMADEVERIYPQAVFETDLTFKAVNYDLLGIQFKEVING